MANLDVDKLCKIVFHEGTISTLIGLPGAGKTNLASVFMDMLTLRGYNIYTNINFFDEKIIGKAINLGKIPKIPGHTYIPRNPSIHTIRSLSDLFIGLLTTEKNVTILDESGIHASSSRAMSKNVQNWKELAFIIRHLSSSLMLLAQSKKSIVPDLRETLVDFEMRVRKLSPRNRAFTIATSVEVIDDYTGESSIKFEVAEGDEYHNIPPTRFPFDSKDFPYFDMDIDLHEALKRLKEFDSITVREDDNGINVIKELKGEQIKEKQYLTTGEYSKKYKIHPSTIRRWIKEGIFNFKTVESARGHGTFEYRILDVPIEKNKI